MHSFGRRHSSSHALPLGLWLTNVEYFLQLSTTPLIEVQGLMYLLAHWHDTDVNSWPFLVIKEHLSTHENPSTILAPQCYLSMQPWPGFCPSMLICINKWVLFVCGCTDICRRHLKKKGKKYCRYCFQLNVAGFMRSNMNWRAPPPFNEINPYHYHAMVVLKPWPWNEIAAVRLGHRPMYQSSIKKGRFNWELKQSRGNYFLPA